MKKIYFWSILILSMMVLLPQQAGAQSDVSVWDGFAESWTQGDGTENNPYLIENARQLAYIAEMVNAGVTHYDSTYFKLTTDIRIDSLFQWQPIGSDGSHSFRGNFDGGCHVITLYLFTNSNYVGLFGYINGSSICNLNLHGKIKSIGYNSNAYIGMIGYIVSSCVYNCINYCNMITNDYIYSSYTTKVGGIGGDILYSTITNCSNFGSIIDQRHSYSCGGICGSGLGSVIARCYNKGNIAAQCTYLGGIIGYVGSSYYGSISNYDTTTILNCYNLGNHISYNQYSIMGGICGSAYRARLFIINNYNSGILNGGESRYGISPYSDYITNCFYLNTCGQNNSNGGGIEKTEAQMKSPSFPVILNSDSVVYVMDTLNINQGYPIFANEIYVVTEDADNITFNSATLNGIYSGNADIKGFRYKAETDSAYNTVYCSLSEPYSFSLSGLSA